MRTIRGAKAVRIFLFLATFFFQLHNAYASEVFAPIISETWECGTNDKISLNITVDNINLSSIGIYNGVLLNSDAQNVHLLRGSKTGQDHKYYSIVLVPNKLINYFKGKDELVIAGKAIVYYQQFSDCFGESHGQVFYNCKVKLER
ncbi:MAG: hypothetical protein PHY93_15440 [Bacteriovorax sp.]|nr:hypothetical protein [Bacteriovorax sp.]